MNGNGQSMQQDYSEEWAVIAGNETFVLDENQVQILKQATLEGQRGLIWFEKFAISIPHIQAIYRMSRTLKNQLEAGETKEREFTEEEREANRERIQKIKEGFLQKHGITK